MGCNLCLLEEMEEGYIEDLIGEGETWWKTWFYEIKKCEETMVDDSRVVWLCIYVIPAHAWSSGFYVGMSDSMGSFVCIDDHTSKGEHMDVARVLVKVVSSFVLSESYREIVDDKVFPLILREDNFGALRVARLLPNMLRLWGHPIRKMFGLMVCQTRR